MHRVRLPPWELKARLRMLGPLGAPELIIIGVIVILLFGVGKISGLGREVGSSIKEFRKAAMDGIRQAGCIAITTNSTAW